MICVGIDSGSRALKIVLLEYTELKTICTFQCGQSVDQQKLVDDSLSSILTDHQITENDICYTVATGYARNLVSCKDASITEITCHAAGVNKKYRDVSVIIEIGGQDSKVIFLDKDGSVRDFAMNDKCAAGTGRFLEMVAEQLNIDIDSIGKEAQKSRNPAQISSMCAVFAESEIINLLSAGTPKEDILAGVEDSIASRLAAMAGNSVAGTVVFTGGVAKIGGMAEAVSRRLKRDIIVVDNPQFTGAYGAALLAADRFSKKT
ncbi:MAG: acyl-CoA dehydratase activase [Planctomycetota bacterium]|jgi:predicted CoA-substrate-specific enzyme activase